MIDLLQEKLASLQERRAEIAINTETDPSKRDIDDLARVQGAIAAVEAEIARLGAATKHPNKFRGAGFSNDPTKSIRIRRKE